MQKVQWKPVYVMQKYMPVVFLSWLLNIRSHFFFQDGFIDFFRTDEGPSDNNASGWRVAAVAGLGLGALLMLACRWKLAEMWF